MVSMGSLHIGAHYAVIEIYGPTLDERQTIEVVIDRLTLEPWGGAAQYGLGSQARWQTDTRSTKVTLVGTMPTVLPMPRQRVWRLALRRAYRKLRVAHGLK